MQVKVVTRVRNWQDAYGSIDHWLEGTWLEPDERELLEKLHKKWKRKAGAENLAELDRLAAEQRAELEQEEDADG